MNVYGITNKSIKFFLDMFKHNIRSKAIDKFIEVEYRPQDRFWAKELMLRQFRDNH